MKNCSISVKEQKFKKNPLSLFLAYQIGDDNEEELPVLVRVWEDGHLLHCWWEGEQVQLFQKVIWVCISKALKMFKLLNLVILLFKNLS